MRARSWLLLLVLSALWGGSYLFIKVALDDGLSAGTIVFIRIALGALVLAPVLARRGTLDALRPHLVPLVVLALLQIVVPFFAIAYGQRFIATGVAAVLGAATPVFVAMLAPWMAPAQRARGRALVGIVGGLAGVALLFVVDLGDLGSDALLGGGLMLLAAFCYAITVLLVGQRFGGVSSAAVVAAMLVISFLLALPLLALDPPQHGVGPLAALVLVALGAGGTGIAFIWYFDLIDAEGAARASILSYTQPLFSVLYGVVLLGEGFHLTTGLGMVLIVGGSWLAAQRRVLAPAGR